MMIKNRVECDKCVFFVPILFKEPGNLFCEIIKKATCELGKRVMFRKPKSMFDSDFGYIRICKDFKTKN